MTTTNSAAALLGWLDPAQVTRHWHGEMATTNPSEIGAKLVDDRDEPLVDAMEWDGGASGDLEPM